MQFPFGRKFPFECGKNIQLRIVQEQYETGSFCCIADALAIMRQSSPEVVTAWVRGLDGDQLVWLDQIARALIDGIYDELEDKECRSDFVISEYSAVSAIYWALQLVEANELSDAIRDLEEAMASR